MASRDRAVVVLVVLVVVDRRRGGAAARRRAGGHCPFATTHLGHTVTMVGKRPSSNTRPGRPRRAVRGLSLLLALLALGAENCPGQTLPSVCTFDSDCGDKGVCINKRCSSCATLECPTGYACQAISYGQLACVPVPPDLGAGCYSGYCPFGFECRLQNGQRFCSKPDLGRGSGGPDLSF